MKIFLRILLGFLILVGAVYIAGVAVSAGHFMPGTKINKIDCSFKTVEQVNEVAQRDAHKYLLTIVERDDKTEFINGNEIGLEIVLEGDMEGFLLSQNIFAWPATLFKGRQLDVATHLSYDEDLMNTKLSTLNCTKTELMRDPHNVRLSEYVEGKGFELISDDDSTYLDVDKFKKCVDAAVLNMDKWLNLIDTECYLTGNDGIKSPEVSRMLKDANNYVNTRVCYEFGEHKEIIDGKQISKWIQIDEDYNVTIIPDVDDFIEDLVEKYNTLHKDRTFMGHEGEEVTAPAGDYGWLLDEAETKEHLLNCLYNCESYTGEAMFKVRGNGFGEDHDFGDTWIEVNIGSQHLWFYKNGEVFLETDFVSGDVHYGHNTHTGVYKVKSKSRDQILRGPGYESPVSYWMPFNGGEGLHDANWRGSFGGRIYLYNGSHGCLNLPPSIARKIYENIEKGCPVVIYKHGGADESAVPRTKEPIKEKVNIKPTVVPQGTPTPSYE